MYTKHIKITSSEQILIISEINELRGQNSLLIFDISQNEVSDME